MQRIGNGPGRCRSRAAAHTLKGSATGIGALAVARAAADVEASAEAARSSRPMAEVRLRACDAAIRRCAAPRFATRCAPRTDRDRKAPRYPSASPALVRRTYALNRSDRIATHAQAGKLPRNRQGRGTSAMRRGHLFARANIARGARSRDLLRACSGQADAKRVALVIGNNDYRSVPRARPIPATTQTMLRRCAGAARFRGPAGQERHLRRHAQGPA